MGGHTDYNEGLVLAMAIDRECVVAASPRPDRLVRLRSLDVPGGEVAFDPGADEPRAVAPAWGRYVAGVAAALAERGRPAAGLDAVLASSVPIGAGLASSAALEVTCALALCAVAEWTLPLAELAIACQDGEHRATGVPCGVMDQLTSLAGREGAALMIDCRTLAVDPVSLPDDLAVVVVHSGLTRTLAGSAYAERRAACERIAAGLGIRALRDAAPNQVRDDPIGRHVVSENARVFATADALRTDDRDALARLFAESHGSLRDDYRVSTPELDLLVAAFRDAGATGARLTGAGFGGAVVALAARDSADAVARAAADRYAAETGLAPKPFVASASAGAGPLAR